MREDAPARLAAVLLPCVASRVDVDALLQRLRADRATGQLLRRVVAAAALVEAARALQADALLELIECWRGLSADSDIEAPSAVVDAQYDTAVLRDALPVALAAARAVSVDNLNVQAGGGVALGEQLAAARRRAIADALRDAALIT